MIVYNIMLILFYFFIFNFSFNIILIKLSKKGKKINIKKYKNLRMLSKIFLLAMIGERFNDILTLNDCY